MSRERISRCGASKPHFDLRDRYRLRKLARKYRKHLVTAAVFAALLLFATVVSVWQAIRLRRSQQVAVVEREAAVVPRDAEAQTRREVEKERDATNQALRESLLQQSRALRASSKAGRRSKSLAAVAKAASIQPALDLRDEYLIALNVPDLTMVRDLPYGTSLKPENNSVKLAWIGHTKIDLPTGLTNELPELALL